jgi:hypothetical protein
MAVLHAEPCAVLNYTRTLSPSQGTWMMFVACSKHVKIIFLTSSPSTPMQGILREQWGRFTRHKVSLSYKEKVCPGTSKWVAESGLELRYAQNKCKPATADSARPRQGTGMLRVHPDSSSWTTASFGWGNDGSFSELPQLQRTPGPRSCPLHWSMWSREAQPFQVHSEEPFQTYHSQDRIAKAITETALITLLTGPALWLNSDILHACAPQDHSQLPRESELQQWLLCVASWSFHGINARREQRVSKETESETKANILSG